MQAIPLITSGAADALGFGNKELALACSSHGGEPRHVERAAAMLARAGLDVAALECGAHAPSTDRAARELLLSGAKPSPLHNNCSGKHAAMLAVARHLGEPTRGYVRPDHSVQLRIAKVIEGLTGAKPGPDVCGIDGCSVPTWALPLDAWAWAFARLAGTASGTAEMTAGRRLMAACMAEPAFVAGEKRFCTEVMAALPGRVFVKTGAEGVFVAAVPGTGLGIALKIDDGATRASEAALAGILAGLLRTAGELDFARWSAKPVRNVVGITAGTVRLENGFAEACSKLPDAGSSKH